MTTKIEELKIKRDQLIARIQKAEARARAAEKKAVDRVKVLVGAAVLEAVKGGQPLAVRGVGDLLGVMDGFLVRPTERAAVLGDDGRGSEALHSVLRITPTPDGLSGGSEAAQDDDGGADTEATP